MPSSNIKIFDQNKENMMSDVNYANHTQRINGVQTGVADSQLQNKFQYQMSLFAYALAQMMNANGIDANDTSAVTTFVANLSNTILQKVADKGTADDIAVGGNNSKWVSPAAVSTFLKSIFNFTGPVKSNGNLDFSEAYATDLKFSSLDSTTIQQYLQNLKYVMPSVVTGSYVGNGQSYKSIDFDSKPVLFIVFPSTYGLHAYSYNEWGSDVNPYNWIHSFIWVKGSNNIKVEVQQYNGTTPLNRSRWGFIDITEGDNSLSWIGKDAHYSSPYPDLSFNIQDITYNYLAILEGNENEVPDIVDITVPGLHLTEEQKEAARDNIDAAKAVTYTDTGNGNIIISWV